MKVPGKFFQTKLLSSLSHNFGSSSLSRPIASFTTFACVQTSPISFVAITTLVGKACIRASRNEMLTSTFADLQYVFSSKTAKLWTATRSL